MKETQLGKPVLPKVPIPVEESRAQRLQRSQARFRDRGGIFVPTARNTLVDILLGRKVASPKKGRGRSASLSPRKKSTGSLRNNEEEAKAVRTSPRKLARRQEPEAGPSNSRDMVLKCETTKKSKKEVVKPATATSKVKVQGDSEKPATKKRGRRPKTAVQDVEHPDTPVDHDPPPLVKSQTTPKKSRIKSVSKKPARLGESKEDSPIESPKKTVKALSATLNTATDDGIKKSSRASTSKKSTAFKRKPTTSAEPGPALLQHSSIGGGLSRTKNASVSDDNRPINEMHQESSRESTITKGKGKQQALQTTHPGGELDVTPVEALPKSRKKRARPAEPEVECSSPSKRLKQAPLEETKPKARRRKAPTAKDTTESNKGTVATNIKDALTKSSPPKKRAREPDDEPPAAQRKKTKGTVDVRVSSDGAAGRQANKRKAQKTKKPSTSRTSRAKKGTTKAPNQDKARAEINTEPGELIISRVRPRKSVMIRMKDPEPHQFLDDDPDPIDFLI